jgi:hypothetical protein
MLVGAAFHEPGSGDTLGILGTGGLAMSRNIVRPGCIGCGEGTGLPYWSVATPGTGAPGTGRPVIGSIGWPVTGSRTGWPGMAVPVGENVGPPGAGAMLVGATVLALAGYSPDKPAPRDHRLASYWRAAGTDAPASV